MTTPDIPELSNTLATPDTPKTADLQPIKPHDAALAHLRRAAPALSVLAALAALGAGGLWLSHQRTDVPRGERLVRINTISGGVEVLGSGTAWTLPGLHQTRLLPAREQTLTASRLARHDGPRALQTIEGLTVGLEVTLRWALDDQRLIQLAKTLPDDIGLEVVEPQLVGLLYQEVSQRTVRELFSSQRTDIQKRVEEALRQRLAAEGVLLKDLQFGAVDLPPDYRKGLDALVTEGLATDRMRYTLELREKQVRETALRATAERERREIEAEASAREQVIAARAQEEAMKHVLPFKQRQIEQRQLEAEAERQARVKLAEGAAQARRIEAEGEASARQKLADAEAYRVTQLGQAGVAQMAREGQLLSRHPLLVQKALVDKLADKVQVIVAPPGTSGQLFANLIGPSPVGESQPAPQAQEE
jgi:regulator of protease activity HflC (stomatin/prohibitin superfamily)